MNGLEQSISTAAHIGGNEELDQNMLRVVDIIRSTDDAAQLAVSQVKSPRNSLDLHTRGWTAAAPRIMLAIAERIRSSVEALAIVNPGISAADDCSGVVTISLGVAFAQQDAAPETVAKWADDALYDAKRGGRNIVFLSNAHAAAETPDARQAAAQPGSAANSTSLMA